VANAVEAHSSTVRTRSSTVALRLDVAEGEIVVEVEDNAGGFDLADVPLGRGLDRLRADLGPDALSAEQTSEGTIIVARIPRASR
jgi:signal transduction histidine kinase